MRSGRAGVTTLRWTGRRGRGAAAGETDLEKVLEEPGVYMRIFGKPEIKGHRRLGVLLATAPTVEEALAKVERAYAKLTVKVY